MKQSVASLLAALAAGFGCFTLLYFNHPKASLLLGLLTVYCMVRSEVMHRSGL